MEPAIPAVLEAGATLAGAGSRSRRRRSVRRPPISGESIIAWALEVRWDIPHGSDHFVAVYVPVAPASGPAPGRRRRPGRGEPARRRVDRRRRHRGDVAAPRPAPGPRSSSTCAGPRRPKGNGVRVELHRRTNAPNGVEGIIAAVAIDPGRALRRGAGRPAGPAARHGARRSTAPGCRSTTSSGCSSTAGS